MSDDVHKAGDLRSKKTKTPGVSPKAKAKAKGQSRLARFKIYFEGI